MRTWLLLVFWLLIALSALARPSQLREAVGGASNFDEPRRVLALAADGWLNRLDASGRLLWDRSYGGSGVDMFHNALRVPGGFLTNGNSFVAGRALPGLGGTRTLSGFGSWDVYAVELAGDLPRLHAPPKTGDEMATNGFRFTLHGLPGQWYRVDRSRDLVEWETLDTRQATREPAGWVDPAAAGNGYYRPTLVPAP